MSKTIVTHQHPDMDAIVSVWLLVRHDQSRYGSAKLAFVPGSTTYKNLPVDGDPEVVHVDVGFGKYDHHQEGGYGTCASELVWRDLVEQGLVAASDEALQAMVSHARAIDLFEDREWEEANLPRFAFSLSEIIPALHRLQIHDDEAVVRMMLVQLDGVYQKLKGWYKSRAEIAKGETFVSRWGKSLAVLSGADDTHKVAQRMGYELVVLGDNKTGYLGIKIAPGAKERLDDLYAKIAELDGKDKWFYHNSGQMLLHGSDKGKKPKPSSLTVATIVELIKDLSN